MRRPSIAAAAAAAAAATASTHRWQWCSLCASCTPLSRSLVRRPPSTHTHTSHSLTRRGSLARHKRASPARTAPPRSHGAAPLSLAEVRRSPSTFNAHTRVTRAHSQGLACSPQARQPRSYGAAPTHGAAPLSIARAHHLLVKRERLARLSGINLFCHHNR